MIGGPAESAFVLSRHALAMVVERDIDISWIERALRHPERVEADSRDRELRHALAPIPERDGRVLRVVYNETTVPWRIVTAYFDRTQRNKQ